MKTCQRFQDLSQESSYILHTEIFHELYDFQISRRCIKNNKIHKQHSGLNEIDGTGKYTSGMLEYLLKCDEMIEEAPLYEREMEEEEELELDDD